MKEEVSDNFVTLRRYHADDALRLYEAVRESIPEISRWMDWCHPDYSMSESATWVLARAEAWASGTDYTFVITDPLDGAFLGSVGLNTIRRDHQFANLGYWVRTGRAGRGAATAATRLAARFGFEELGLTRIEIVAATDNTASRRVAEKVGAREEAILRNRLIIGGRPHDAAMYSLIPQDLYL
jgi:RimJ/RimL family protein N-acetyltransferase